MPDYHELYLKLAAVQADTIDTLKETMARLIQSHREAEEIIMTAPEPKVVPLNPKQDGR